MTGDDVRQVFAAMRPQDELDRLCETFGVIERERKLHLGMFVRAMVISAGTPGGAYQADVRRSYLEFEVPQVARSAFSRWFDAPLERCMEALAARALADARAPQVARSGPLGGVTDGSIVDATPVTVRDTLVQEFPGTGDDAALKVHTVLSVGGGAPVHDHCRPAREPARRPLTVDASWRGYGRRADLASASLARLRACEDHGVRFVIRLQENWQPKVDAMARGQVTPAFFPGGDLDALLADEPLVLDGRAIDADVPVGGATQPRHRRRIGVHTPTGDRCCLTPLLPRIGPWPGADLSRVRWEVARSLRLDQSGPRVDQLAAERPWTGKTRFQAALLASTLAARLAHRPHLQTRPPQLGAPRTEAPLRTRRRALPRAVSCQSLAQAFDLEGAEAKQRWDKIAKILRPSGKDPNGRRQPSILDQLRGWKRQPVSRTNASKHHANVA